MSRGTIKNGPMAGRRVMRCDNDACGKTVAEHVGQRTFFEVTSRAPIKPTLLPFHEDRASYGEPVYLDACSGECLALIYEKQAGHCPKAIEQIAILEEKHADA